MNRKTDAEFLGEVDTLEKQERYSLAAMRATREAVRARAEEDRLSAALAQKDAKIAALEQTCLTITKASIAERDALRAELAAARASVPTCVCGHRFHAGPCEHGAGPNEDGSGLRAGCACGGFRTPETDATIKALAERLVTTSHLDNDGPCWCTRYRPAEHQARCLLFRDALRLAGVLK